MIMELDKELYSRLIKAVAKRYAEDEEEMEEMIAAGWVGLNRASNSFKEDAGITFISYAIWFIARSARDVKGKK